MSKTIIELYDKCIRNIRSGELFSFYYLFIFFICISMVLIYPLTWSYIVFKALTFIGLALFFLESCRKKKMIYAAGSVFLIMLNIIAGPLPSKADTGTITKSKNEKELEQFEDERKFVKASIEEDNLNAIYGNTFNSWTIPESNSKNRIIEFYIYMKDKRGYVNRDKTCKESLDKELGRFKNICPKTVI